MYRYLALLVVCGCGLDRNVHPTIEQGVYGLLVEGCDTNDCADQPAMNEHVIVYAPGQNSGNPIADTHSNGDGVYQIPLPAGDYTLCTYSCTPITVPDHGTVRFDWTSGPGGGHWQKM